MVLFSANVWSYITASENLRLWGKALRFYPHGEGETFLGFVPWLLALRGSRRFGAAPHFRKEALRASVSPWLTYVSAFLLLAVITQLIAVLSVVLFGGFEFWRPISARTPQRLLLQFVIASALLLGISPRARIETARLMRSPIAFAFAATILAMWLSLGPLPNAGEARVSGFGLYGLLYDYVPGFNGVRVPARYAMIAGLFLAIVAGYGFKHLLSLIPDPRSPIPVLAVASLLILIEGAAIPMEMNRTWNQNEAVPPARVYSYGRLDRRSLAKASRPSTPVSRHCPRARRSRNSRSATRRGRFATSTTPPRTGSRSPTATAAASRRSYKERVARMQRIAKDPEAAWQSLKDSGSTHVVLHRNAFANGADADTVESWLKAHGATGARALPR